MIEAPSMSKSHTQLGLGLGLEPKASNSSNLSMSTLGPSASVVSREMEATAADALDADGNVWWKTAKPTNAVLSAFRIQFDNNLLLAEVRRLRESVRELQTERDEAHAEVEQLTNTVADKTA